MENRKTIAEYLIMAGNTRLSLHNIELNVWICAMCMWRSFSTRAHVLKFLFAFAFVYDCKTMRNCKFEKSPTAHRSMKNKTTFDLTEVLQITMCNCLMFANRKTNFNDSTNMIHEELHTPHSILQSIKVTWRFAIRFTIQSRINDFGIIFFHFR